MGVGFMAYLTFIFAMQLPWAFRGDIDHMDSLKTLPVAPLALAVGELAGGVVLLAAIQLVLLVGLLGAGGNPALILTAAAFLIPFDVLMLGVSNMLFLIYPVRLVPGTAADFQLMGRMMLLMLLQFLILIPSLGIPAALGGLAFWLSGFHLAGVRRSSPGCCSWPNCRSGCSCSRSAFERFDPSTETPA